LDHCSWLEPEEEDHGPLCVTDVNPFFDKNFEFSLPATGELAVSFPESYDEYITEAHSHHELPEGVECSQEFSYKVSNSPFEGGLSNLEIDPVEGFFTLTADSASSYTVDILVTATDGTDELFYSVDSINIDVICTEESNVITAPEIERFLSKSTESEDDSLLEISGKFEQVSLACPI
jgi:hypothetical protein